jgi:hypothetical protein
MKRSNSMRSTQRLAVSTLLTLAVLAGCAAAPQVGSDADRNADFAGYHSFALLPRERVVMSMPPDAMRNPLVISRIEDEVEREMQRTGYALADPASADLVVDFAIGAQQRIDVHALPADWGPGPGWPGPTGHDIDVRQFRKGTLAIDVYDVRTRRPLWHGWAQKELTRKDLEQSSAPIHEAVESVLAKFPPAS